MTGIEDRYRRLLRWYPSSWRAQHEEVVLGTLLDTAEAAGRDRPTSGEAFALAVHGSAARLNAQLGLGFAVAASIVCAVAGAVTAFFPQIMATGLNWLSPALLLVVAPTLIALAGTGWLRESGALGPVRSIILPPLAALAGGAGLAAALSWSEGFAAANAGITRTPGEALPTLLWFLASWLLGAVALALAAEAMLHRTRLPTAARWAITTAAGLVLAPVVGLSLFTPTLGVLVSVALTLSLTIRAARRRRPDDPPALQLALPWQAEPRARSTPLGLAATLAWFSAVVGLGGIAFALTGSLWFDHGLDATRTMQLGIAIGLLAAILLLIAFAAAMPARTLSTLTPVGLGIVALGIVAAGYAFPIAGAWDSMWTAILVAMPVSGAAVGTAIYHGLIRGTRPERIWLATIIGAGYAVTLGILFMFATAFVAPVLAVIFATWGIRALRRRRGVLVAAGTPG